MGEPAGIEHTESPRGAASRVQRVLRHRLFRVFRVAAGLVLLGVLLTRVSLQDLAHLVELTLGNWPLLLLALLMPGVGVVFSSFRLRLLLRTQGARFRLRELCAVNLIGSFYNQFLPSTVGGDVVRGYLISRMGRAAVSDGNARVTSAPVSFTVVGLDRLIGSLGILALGLIAAGMNPALVRQSPELQLVLLAALGGMLLLALLPLLPARSLGRRFFSLKLLRHSRQKAVLIYNALKAYRSSKLALVVAFLLSLALQFTIVVQYWLFVSAMELGISFQSLAILIPVVNIFAMLPLTINGIGVREGVLFAFGARMGLTLEGSIALGLAFLWSRMMWGLVGGVLHLRRRN